MASISSRVHGSSLEFKAEVVGFTTTEPVDTFVTNLSKSLDTDVIQVDASHLEIRKSFTQAELEPYFAAEGGTVVCTSLAYRQLRRTW